VLRPRMSILMSLLSIDIKKFFTEKPRAESTARIFRSRQTSEFSPWMERAFKYLENSPKKLKRAHSPPSRNDQITKWKFK
jgi:hypothetical protein